MKQWTRITLKALSGINLNIKKNYRLYRKVQKIMTPSLKSDYLSLDRKIMSGDREIPIRVFHPQSGPSPQVMIFIHGGGWVIGDIDSYTPVCVGLAEATKHTVVSIDYSLAPEHPFPMGLEDCYIAVREIYRNPQLLSCKKENITLIGDSAGGNLAAVVSLKARDTGDFHPERQILIYPATYYDHTEASPYRSVLENGENYLLTAERIQDYMELYVPDAEARKDPYVAPLLSEDLTFQPKTLIITAEFDPLRDEGEAYGKKLRSQGNTVRVFRMNDAIHGYLGNPLAQDTIDSTYEIIKLFLSEEG
ncbi:alpha/beta hydrolase [Proteiniclasticum sp.]|uniref:alpha/beta hydrolase n=1 Tax=Proteiniclasticum sp. TaxID=2053595 RepID=UPI0028A1B221|nr:alpha/beta hydrolase [Proteiniclasticum sp.]